LKLIISLIASFLLFTLQELSDVRRLFVEAPVNVVKSEAFYDFIGNYNREDKVLWAYKGAAITLKAKFAKTLKEKKRLFTEGVQWIENAVKSEPNNVEIRLIRLSIQENAPKILNYKKNIEEDKKLLLSNLEQQNLSLKEYIKKYIKQSDIFTDKEKKSILN
jgi:hypothetical protein